MKTIVLTASSGGHFEQLSVLKKRLEKDYIVNVITEKTQYTKNCENTFLIKQINRKKINFLFTFISNWFKVEKIIKKVNPDVVISIGALATIPVCKIAHKKRKKVIFIESFAKINTPTMTGKYIYKFADVFIVQRKELLDVYPNAIYLNGGIY